MSQVRRFDFIGAAYCLGRVPVTSKSASCN